MRSFWYFFDTKYSWETPLLIISNAYLSIPILIKLSLISLFPHHPRKFGLAKKKIKTSMLIKPMVKFQSSLYLIYHSLPLETLPSFCVQETISSSFIFFLPAVLATPSLSPLLICLHLSDLLLLEFPRFQALDIYSNYCIPLVPLPKPVCHADSKM